MSEEAAGAPTVAGDEAWVSPRARRLYVTVIKRALDVTLVTGFLLMTLPLWPVIALAIKLESEGPVFHVQERVGLHGRRFRFLKFRSMTEDAAQRLVGLRALNEAGGPAFKMRRDPRVTRVGRFLRRSSLDELPQFWNVLKGDMSLVGPRPALPWEVERYRPEDLVRLTVKPGLTCLWQISGRSETPFEAWMELDRTYVSRVSLGLDLWIVLRTFWAVLSCRGAY